MAWRLLPFALNFRMPEFEESVMGSRAKLPVTGTPFFHELPEKLSPGTCVFAPAIEVSRISRNGRGSRSGCSNKSLRRNTFLLEAMALFILSPRTSPPPEFLLVSPPSPPALARGTDCREIPAGLKARGGQLLFTPIQVLARDGSNRPRAAA